jgi:HK97 family phage major capsid protein
MSVATLRKQFIEKLQEIQAVAKKVEDEGRTDYTDEERGRLQAGKDALEKLNADMKKAGEDDALRKAIDALGADSGIELNPDPQPGITGEPVRAGKGQTVGERFVKSDGFQAWLKSYGGRIPDSLQGWSSPPVEMGGLKTLITGVSATSAGALVFPQDLGLRDTGTFMRPLTIRDIVTSGQTTTDSVEYVRVTGFTNAAAPTAEATATSGSSGAKPESAMTLERVSTSVKTIAHWIPVTKRALSDAGQIRTLIDSFLRYGLEEELEDQMMTGNGTGENFTGLASISGTQAQAFDTNIVTTARKARTKIRVVGRATPTAYVMNPSDWETFDLLQDNEARYFYGGPMALGVPRLWGLPVIESEAATAGTAWVGDFRTLVLWDREQASIQVSDQHESFFVRNLVAILAEMRAAFGCFRPSALCSVDLTA